MKQGENIPANSRHTPAAHVHTHMHKQNGATVLAFCSDLPPGPCGNLLVRIGNKEGRNLYLLWLAVWRQGNHLPSLGLSFLI